MTKTPQDLLATDDPKCANCRFMAPAGKREPRRTRWYEPKTPSGYKENFDAPFEPISGKGACMEPSLMKYAERGNRLQLFLVTDLMLCSKWERK